MLEQKTLEMIRSLASRLSPDERLDLIRAIIDSASHEPDAWSTQLREEAAYWYARPAEEREPYRGRYVAVHRKTVIDHDADRRALYLRVRRRFPDTLVLLTKADAQMPPEFTILSPRIGR